MGAGVRYLKKNFDEAAILAVLVKMKLESAAALSVEDETVLAALRRSNGELDGASIEQIQEYAQSLDEEQIPGLVNNVKGILHEMEFVEMENADGDTIYAALFADTNHPGYDVVLTDSETGDVFDLQLKATDSVSDVDDWISDHPDGEILLTSELADKLDLPSSGISNEHLTYRVEDVVDRLQEMDDTDSIWHHFPALTLASAAVVVWALFCRYRRGELTLAQFKLRAAAVTGMKLAKIGVLSLLLSIPGVNVVTGSLLVAKMILSTDGGFSRIAGIVRRARHARSLSSVEIQRQ